MFSNKFRQKLGHILGILIFTSVCAFATDNTLTRFHRKVFDRLSVIYLMSGEMEKSIAVQRRAMNLKSRTPALNDVAKDTNSLVDLLKATNKDGEAEKWQSELENLTGKKILVTEKVGADLDKSGSTFEIGSDTKAEEPEKQSVKPAKRVAQKTRKKATQRIVRSPEKETETKSEKIVKKIPAKNKNEHRLQAGKINSLITPKSIKGNSQSYNPAKPLFPEQSELTATPATSRKSLSLSSQSESGVDELKSLSDTRVSLNFRDAEIADVVRMLATKGNLNIVSKNPIEGRTTVNFDNIHVGLALDIILRTNDYFYEIKDKVIWVFKKGEEPLETKVFFLRHALAADIIPMIEQTLSHGQVASSRSSGAASNDSGSSAGNAEGSDSAGSTGLGMSSENSDNAQGDASNSSSTTRSSTGSSQAGVYLDEKTNSIIVTASSTKLREVARLIEIYDVPGASRQEEKVFKLMHIDKQTLENAIKMVVPRFDPAKQMFEVKHNGQADSSNQSGSIGR
jgi:hypothetical protein